MYVLRTYIVRALVYMRCNCVVVLFCIYDVFTLCIHMRVEDSDQGKGKKTRQAAD